MGSKVNHNKEWVIHLAKENPEITQTEISERTGISRHTVCKYLNEEYPEHPSVGSQQSKEEKVIEAVENNPDAAQREIARIAGVSHAAANRHINKHYPDHHSISNGKGNYVDPEVEIPVRLRLRELPAKSITEIADEFDISRRTVRRINERMDDESYEL